MRLSHFATGLAALMSRHAARDGLARGTIRGGRRHHRVPLEAAPAADIGLKVVAPIVIASVAMRLVSHSGHFQPRRSRRLQGFMGFEMVTIPKFSQGASLEGDETGVTAM